MSTGSDKIVLATGNAGKIKELQAFLATKTCVPQGDLGICDAEETGSTFVENALLKARHACRISHLPAISDDSGLVVPALNGQPGIYSSRFSGPDASDQDNIDKLLAALEIPLAEGGRVEAFFYCVIAYMQHAEDPMPLLGTGVLKGEIIPTPKGTHGFGYSPVFYIPDYQCTLAELPILKRNTMSHRAGALKMLERSILDLNKSYTID
jgi:XTP/dITP diphosphohydrolase